MKKRILQFMALMLTVSSIESIPVIASANENTQKETYSKDIRNKFRMVYIYRWELPVLTKQGLEKFMPKELLLGK